MRPISVYEPSAALTASRVVATRHFASTAALRTDSSTDGVGGTRPRRYVGGVRGGDDGGYCAPATRRVRTYTSEQSVLNAVAQTRSASLAPTASQEPPSSPAPSAR